MTVEALIKMLRRYPPTAIVRVYDGKDWGMQAVTGILSGPEGGGAIGHIFVDLESDT